MALFCSMVYLALLCSAWFWRNWVMSPDTINILVFPMDKCCVPCAAGLKSCKILVNISAQRDTAPAVTIFTASLTFSNSTFCPHNVFMCFVWISEQTAIMSLYSINWLVCITETEFVYCAVRTISLYIIQVEICALLGYYAACSGNSLLTFRGNLSVPYSRVKKSQKSAVLIYFASEAQNRAWCGVILEFKGLNREISLLLDFHACVRLKWKALLRWGPSRRNGCLWRI